MFSPGSGQIKQADSIKLMGELEFASDFAIGFAKQTKVRHGQLQNSLDESHLNSMLNWTTTVTNIQTLRLGLNNIPKECIMKV